MSDFTPIKILLVEDDRDSVEFTKKILSGAGILNSLEIARTGQEALSAVRASHPHIVLLDWVLPDIPGNKILRDIKHESKDTIVVVLSVHIPERMEITDRTVLPDYYISKPIDPIQFMMILKSIGKFGFNIVSLGGK